MSWVTGWDNGGVEAGVVTFNGRFGVVTAELGDYIAGQITDGVSTLGGATVLASLDNAKTAIDALGARPVMLVPPELTSLVAGNVTRLVYRGPSGVIDAMDVVMSGGLSALTTATLQLAIEGADVTDGLVSIPAGSAGAGTVHSATPSADNTIADGDVISVTTGGLNLLDTRATVTLRLAL
jgi:hypothetical protein